MTTQARGMHKLRQVFPEGEIYAVSDCEWVAMAAGYYGLESLTLADAAKLPDDANVVLFLRQNLVSADLRKRFRHARVLVVPIASFDPALEAALYTQKLVMLTDYIAACERGRYWVDTISNQDGRLVFAGQNGDDEMAGRTELICSFADDLSAAAWLEPELRAGQWVSVGSYCEISLTSRPARDQPAPFSLDGTAIASGVLVARDPRFSTTGDGRIKAAEGIRRELVCAAPVSLRLEDGALTEVQAGGRDFTDAVREVTNPQYGLRALELGIGTNQAVLPDVRWQVNSQLNEGVGPVHLGFGEGVTGAHMDFIVADGTHRFIAGLDR